MTGLGDAAALAADGIGMVHTTVAAVVHSVR